MSSRNRIAFVCLVVPALVEICLGVLYLTASEPMPYHLEALPAGALAKSPGVSILLMTLLNGYGSAHLSVGLALLVMLLVPFRLGLAWARWGILAVGMPVLGATAFLSWRLAAATGAEVPWPGSLFLLIVFLAGIAIFEPKTAEASNRHRAPTQ